MGCGASIDDEGKKLVEHDSEESKNSTDSKYRDGGEPGSRRSSGAENSDLSPQEHAQVSAIRLRRRNSKRACSLATDSSMRHYQLVTGNQREDDEYFDATRIKVKTAISSSPFRRGSVSSSKRAADFSESDDGADSEHERADLSRKSSLRSSNGSFNGSLKKSVSFSTSSTTMTKWRPCVK